MKNQIEVSMIVTIPEKTSLEDFNEAFVDWIEDNGCTCSGSMKPYCELYSMDEAKDLLLGKIGTERRDNYEAELKKLLKTKS